MAYYLYNSQLDAFTLYHLIQEAQSASKPSVGPGLPALGHAVSGSAGTAISHLLIYPLDLVITRLQVQKQIQGSANSADDEYKGIRDAVEKIYQQEGGLQAFYSGCAYDTAKSVVDSFLFFLAYNFLRDARQKSRGESKPLPISNELLVGMAAGAFSKLFTTPVQNIVTRKQTAALSAARDKSTSRSPELSARDIALQIKDEKGILGFWSGYSATLVLTLNPALTFLLHETFTRTLLPKSRRNDPGARITFLLAAISKAIASSITYPFSLAKTRAQVSSRKSDAGEDAASKEDADKKMHEMDTKRKAAERTVFATILRIAQTEGVGALYQGLSGEVMKGFFTHGLTMLMKERIHKFVIQLYYLILKTLRRYNPELARKSRLKLAEAKRAVQPYAYKGTDIADDLVKHVGQVASDGANVTHVTVIRTQEELEELCERGMAHARDILWGIVDDDDDF